MGLDKNLFFFTKHTQSIASFWFNPTETFIDIKKTNDGNTESHWISEAGLPDIFMLPGPDVRSLYRQYAQMTGTSQLPPLFSLGYHQCRWNYRDEAGAFCFACLLLFFLYSLPVSTLSIFPRYSIYPTLFHQFLTFFSSLPPPPPSPRPPPYHHHFNHFNHHHLQTSVLLMLNLKNITFLTMSYGLILNIQMENVILHGIQIYFLIQFE